MTDVNDSATPDEERRGSSTSGSCYVCGAPATVNNTRHDWLECEDCALKYGYRAEGSIDTALAAIGFAVSIMRHLSVPASTIRASINQLLDAPETLDSAYYHVPPDDFLYEANPSDPRRLPWGCEVQA